MYLYTSLLNAFTDIRRQEYPHAQVAKNAKQCSLVRKITIFVCFKRHLKSQMRCIIYNKLIAPNVQVLHVGKASVNVYNKKWGLANKGTICSLRHQVYNVYLVKFNNLRYKSDNSYSTSNRESEVCQNVCKC